MPAIGSAAGFVLGAIQVVRENAATWGAVHATPATIMLQTVAGALLGAAFIGAATAYLFMRRGPAKAAAAARPLRTTRAGPEIPREGARSGARQVVIMIFALALLALGSLVLVACVTWRHPTVYLLLDIPA